MLTTRSLTTKLFVATLVSFRNLFGHFLGPLPNNFRNFLVAQPVDRGRKPGPHISRNFSQRFSELFQIFLGTAPNTSWNFSDCVLSLPTLHVTAAQQGSEGQIQIFSSQQSKHIASPLLQLQLQATVQSPNATSASNVLQKRKRQTCCGHISQPWHHPNKPLSQVVHCQPTCKVSVRIFKPPLTTLVVCFVFILDMPLFLQALGQTKPEGTVLCVLVVTRGEPFLWYDSVQQIIGKHEEDGPGFTPKSLILCYCKFGTESVHPPPRPNASLKRPWEGQDHKAKNSSIQTRSKMCPLPKPLSASPAISASLGSVQTQETTAFSRCTTHGVP